MTPNQIREEAEKIAKKCRWFIKFGMDDDEIYRMRDCLESVVLSELLRREERIEFANIKISKRDTEIKTLRQHLSPDEVSTIARILELKDLLQQKEVEIEKLNEYVEQIRIPLEKPLSYQSLEEQIQTLQARVKKLEIAEKALKNIVSYLGPEVPECCEGGKTEMQMALDEAKESLSELKEES